MVKEWNKTTGSLPLNAKVTAYGELAGEKLNKDSFWAVVTDISRANENIYVVKDAKGKEYIIPRSLLRHQKRHSVATGHITDDKIHDRHAMQKFMDQELKYLEKYMSDYYPEDIPTGNNVRLHQHSDNASHFKSTGAIIISRL